MLNILRVIVIILFVMLVMAYVTILKLEVVKVCTIPYGSA
jgi:hypothetical protein